MMDGNIRTDEAIGELRIVLVGQTGSGISTAGNTILGRDAFYCTQGQDSNSITEKCTPKRGDIHGKWITVVDTPGVDHNGKCPEYIYCELASCLSLCDPGPHAFVLVLQLGNESTGDQNAVSKIEELFGIDFPKYTVVLFTCGRLLKEDQTIEEYIADKAWEKDPFLKNLVDKCGGRVHVIDDKWNEENASKDTKRSNGYQIGQLFASIQTIVKNNGGHPYKNKRLQDRSRKINEEFQKLLQKRKEKGDWNDLDPEKKKHEEEMIWKKATENYERVGLKCVVN